jgi:hypothetical protein
MNRYFAIVKKIEDEGNYEAPGCSFDDAIEAVNYYKNRYGDRLIEIHMEVEPPKVTIWRKSTEK